MAIFRIRMDRGVYLLRGEIEKRLEEATDFVIVADSKDAAKSFSAKFIGDKVGQSSPHISHAVFDDVGEWLERWQPLPQYKLVTDVIEEAKSFVGSISIDGIVIICPEHETDTIIISVSEGEKVRVIIEPLAALEEGPQWGANQDTFNLNSLAKAVQSVF